MVELAPSLADFIDPALARIIFGAPCIRVRCEFPGFSTNRDCREPLSVTAIRLHRLRARNFVLFSVSSLVLPLCPIMLLDGLVEPLLAELITMTWLRCLCLNL